MYSDYYFDARDSDESAKRYVNDKTFFSLSDRYSYHSNIFISPSIMEHENDFFTNSDLYF